MTSNAFLSSIEQHFHSMTRFEDAQVISKARSLIPTMLEFRAVEQMRKLQALIKKGEASDENITIQELLLLELLDWFKNSFFEWVNSPDCDYCYSETQYSHMSSDPVLLKQADRVEMHRCQTCEKFTPFFRYNDLDILLDTREGRCGEWAQVFTLFCYAMGWDARLVYDVTDHVWTEVYSVAQKRWLHCDPCENICDNSLIYETGWNKQLSYIIAYSIDDIQDVTWRYSADHKQILKNRDKCSELELIDLLMQLRADKQNKCTPARRKYLTKRLLEELVELMVEKKPTDAEKQGRKSGSLTWRLQRGETKIGNTKIWYPTENDLQNGFMSIRYNPILDQYERICNDNVVETISTWQKGIFNAQNVFRKVEKDWNIVYLCREESTEHANIQWRFEIGSSEKTIDKVSLYFDTKTFENGQIKVQISGDSTSIDLTSSSLETTELKGSTFLMINASLSGGNGSCAWQHTQLFRRPINSKDFPFLINMTFN